jgi:hypothetical protein
MTTFAPNQETERKLEELDERTRAAWSAYRESLRDLSGRDYDEAEDASWDVLQRTLRHLGEERAELEPPAAARPSPH